MNDLYVNVYRNDDFFNKLKEIYDKYKNHRDKTKKIAKYEKDLLLLRLNKNFTKFPNILLDQLAEVQFNCKDCFKACIMMYRFTLVRNKMTFKCKKEYLRQMIRVNRSTLERVLDELQEKNMLLLDKSNSYFYFTLNLCFNDWNLTDTEKATIEANVEREIEKLNEVYIIQ